MEENFKNKLGLFTFLFVIIFLAIGGYFFTNYILQEPKEEISEQKNKVNYKIDKKKDYIYFINEEVISENAEIYYKDVVINLNTQTVLNDALEKENKIYKENIKYISDMQFLSNEIINYNNDNLYALNFREYKTYEFDKYVSLLINDYNYSCFDLITFNNSKSYVFNTETGELMNEEELLKIYNSNIDVIKENIKNYLLQKQTVVDNIEVIKVQETIDNLSYGLYMDDYGKLYISYLVKTTQVDYNETMEDN